MKRVKVSTRPPYEVLVGRDLLGKLPHLLTMRFPAKRAVLVSDAYLMKGPAGALSRWLRGSGWTVDAFALPRGESAKSLSALTKLYSFMLSRKVERSTPLLAVGGGAVGDAAGFAAATYFRGIPLVHVPTTLLAQVDSAIGGKTAVNHPEGKNAIGAFYQPSLVVADVARLRSLPRREFMSGLAEVVKYALVFDRGLLKRLNEHWDGVMARDLDQLEDVVGRCVSWKARIVASDERDLTGRRELLNFGHTLGHALETATNYRVFRHGEAVAWGMLFAAALSVGRGWMKKSPGALHLLSRLEPPRWPKSLRRTTLLAALASDKKVKAGKNVFVLLRDSGRPVRVRDVRRKELEEALEAIA